MTRDVVKERRVVAGRDGDYVSVRHLVLEGSQADVGCQLAREAAAVFGASPRPVPARLGHARQAWFARHWPEHEQRSAGMAAAFGVAADDPVLVDDLIGSPLDGGCSAVWSQVAAGTSALLVRNFDIHSSAVAATPKGRGEPLPALARPYVIEMHPDEGLASVTITGNNLAGCLEGINEAGLAVATLADNCPAPVMESLQVGLDEALLPRFVLDRFRTAADARAGLDEAEHYVRFTSCHYLIADAAGDAFVWEMDAEGGKHIIDATRSPFIVTDYPLADHPDSGALPADGEGNPIYPRATLLHDTLKSEASTPAALHAALDHVRAESGAGTTAHTVTLWRTEYDPGAASMTARFLLGLNEIGVQRSSESLRVDLRQAVWPFQ